MYSINWCPQGTLHICMRFLFQIIKSWHSWHHHNYHHHHHHHHRHHHHHHHHHHLRCRCRPPRLLLLYLHILLLLLLSVSMRIAGFKVNGRSYLAIAKSFNLGLVLVIITKIENTPSRSSQLNVLWQGSVQENQCQSISTRLVLFWTTTLQKSFIWKTRKIVKHVKLSLLIL